MTAEAARYLEKAQQCLSNARIEFDVGLYNDAARNAYLAAFHAAQGFIFERAGKIAKTHGGVHREFGRLSKAEPAIENSRVVFLAQAYNLKAVAGRGGL